MFDLFEIADLAAAGTLLVGMRESLGVLAIGITLALSAVLTRSFLARGDRDKNNGETTKRHN